VEHVDFLRGLGSFKAGADTVAKLYLNLHVPALNGGAEAPASEFDRLAADVIGDRWTGAEVKKLHARLLETGAYEPSSIVRAVGDEVDRAVAQVVADNAEAVARYKDGKASLLGFFIGKTMAATQGRADAGEVRKALIDALGR
jgi:Asp-tRNA(Asn)/Glu-tRNA(Gln) amidotransferase B subunit